MSIKVEHFLDYSKIRTRKLRKSRIVPSVTTTFTFFGYHIHVEGKGDVLPQLTQTLHIKAKVHCSSGVRSELKCCQISICDLNL